MGVENKLSIGIIVDKSKAFKEMPEFPPYPEDSLVYKHNRDKSKEKIGRLLKRGKYAQPSFIKRVMGYFKGY